MTKISYERPPLQYLSIANELALAASTAHLGSDKLRLALGGDWQRPRMQNLSD